jgi:hypothetical protein
MNKEKRAVVDELHKPVRHRFPRRRIIIKGLDDLWQADFVQMIPCSRENKGFNYFIYYLFIYLTKYVMMHY